MFDWSVAQRNQAAVQEAEMLATVNRAPKKREDVAALGEEPKTTNKRM